MTAPPAPSAGKQWPGMPCSSADDCYTKICTSGFCVGLPDGTTCASDTDCSLGSSCKAGRPNNTCTAQVGLGEMCDTFTGIQCQNNYVCNNQKCVAYYSKPLGSFVTLDTAGMACASGHAHKVDTKFGYCDSAAKSANVPSPTECTFACPSNDGFEAAQCKCGYNADAK